MKHCTQIVIFILISTFSTTVFCQHDTIKKVESDFMIFGEYPLPEYLGGIEALLEFVNSRTLLAREFDTCKVAGKVYIKFNIDTNGSVISPRVLKGINPKLDSMAINIVKSLPKWIPATQNGKPVVSEFILPIKYGLDKNEKKKRNGA